MPRILERVRAHGAAVVVAPPGSGKTTRIPVALAADGPLILLQPRRVAARSLARRIAEEQGWTLGEEVGWQVRFERRFSARTRVLVATEGVLTARLQSDPLLTGFRTVVLDEFHERTLHADLGLAFARQAARARGDLRLVVLSATLDAGPVAEFLGGCPVVEASGRPYPVEVVHRPGASMADAVREGLAADGGHLLCFLPGAADIRRAAGEIARLTEAGGASVLPLHGSLRPEEQDRALAPSTRRKIVLATNIAETSLTINGVTTVVDSGLHKVLRYDAAKGLDRLETERIPMDSATQRAGRAGRTAPGRALRLWDPRETLRERRQPEIERVDLVSPLLDVLAWGGDPLDFEWFEAPPPEAVQAALATLQDLGAADGRRLTATGEALRRLPLHPRLARVLLAAGGSRRAAVACAILSERVSASRSGPVADTDSDVLSLVDRVAELPFAIRGAAEQIERMVAEVADGADAGSFPPVSAASEEAVLRRALLAGYPDRVARRREPGSPRLVLCSGHGAVLGPESGVRQGELLVALDLAAGERGPGSEALVRLASRIEREWLLPTARDLEHRFDPESASVRAVERLWYRRLVLRESPVAPEPEAAAAVLAAELRARGLGADGEAILRRLRFAGLPVDRDGLIQALARTTRSLSRLDLRAALGEPTWQELERRAPTSIAVPSGRSVPLEYREDGTVAASVKLQELFGLAETPRVGPRAEPVLLHLLSPGGRPVQTTRDLRSFWARTYPEVRKELRGRYPRHPWPEDPWTATPTARAKRRRA